MPLTTTSMLMQIHERGKRRDEAADSAPTAARLRRADGRGRGLHRARDSDRPL